MPRSAIVIGGGPAGGSAAIGLRRMGLDVTLVEQRTVWKGRVCTCFLTPEAGGELDHLGLLAKIRAAGGTDIEKVSLTFPRGEPVEVDVRREGFTGLALTRQVLEESLLGAARDAGAAVEMGTTASSVHGDGDRWSVSLRDSRDRTSRRKFTLVVLADGYYTLAADAASKPRRGWFGWNASFTGDRRAPGTMSLNMFPGGYVGVQTCACGTTTVSGLTWHARGQTRPWQAEFDEALKKSKPLRDEVYGLTRAEEWRGVGPIPFRHRQRPSNGPVAVGDAAAVSDPFIGDGLARALAAGPMLTRAIAEAGSLRSEDVSRAHARLWNQRYSRRLVGGPWIRAAVRSATLFRIAEKVVFRRRAFIDAMVTRCLAPPDRTPLPEPARSARPAQEPA